MDESCGIGRFPCWVDWSVSSFGSDTVGPFIFCRFSSTCVSDSCQNFFDAPLSGLAITGNEGVCGETIGRQVV